MTTLTPLKDDAEDGRARSSSANYSGRLRGNKPVIPVEKDSKYRVFKALQDREYAGPSLQFSKDDIKPPVNTKTTSQVVFLGPRGELYNVHYIPLDANQAKNLPIKEITLDDNNNKEFRYDITSKIFREMPTPDKFENYFEYEKSLLEWKDRVEESLGPVKLPHVMGRHYYRPRATIERLRGSSGSNDYLEAPKDVNASPDTSSPANAETKKQEENMDEELFKRVSTEMSKAQFMKILQKKRANSANSSSSVPIDDDLRQMLFDKEPWDSTLVPEEPSPYLYDTYEEYEAAMKRWALLCTQLAAIPPHASQLKDLIPIQTIENTPEGKTVATDDTGEEADQNHFKIKPIAIQFPFFKQLNTPGLTPIPRGNVTLVEDGREYESLPQPIRDKLKLIFDQLVKPPSESKSKPHNKPILPIMHGTFPKPWERSGSPAPTGTRGKSSKNKALRRSDLTGPMLASCMDCPGEIDGKRVEFRIPEFDIESIDLNRLKEDAKYNDQIRQNVRSVHSSDRYDSLNSWYHPTIPKDVHIKYRSQVEEIIRGNSKNFTLEHLAQVFSSGMFLDRLQDLFAEQMKEDDDNSAARTYFQYFLNVITPDNFPQLLQFYERFKSPLIHAKISAFVSEVLQSSRAKVLLEKLILGSDIVSLSLVAYGMSFFNETPLDLIPVAENIQMCAMVIDKSATNLLIAIYCVYYVGIISNIINKQPFIFVAVNQFVNESRKSLANGLCGLLQEPMGTSGSTFLNSGLWKLISSRSAHLSQIGLFILVQLMNNQDSLSLQGLLRSETVSLWGHVRGLAKTTKSHVQFALRRIFHTVARDSSWCEYWNQYYNTKDELFLEDITLACNKNGQANLLAELTVQHSIQTLQRLEDLQPNLISFLLDETTYNSVLKHVLQHQKAADDRTRLLTSLMVELTKALVKLNLLNASPTVKTIVKKRGNMGFTVSPIEIQKMCAFITEVSRTDADVEATYVVKTNVLKCLRHMTKPITVYDQLLKKEAEFYSKVAVFCRDGNNMKFNREAWKTFYQMIFYHFGVLDYLVKANMLAPFLELVGTSSNTTIMLNGLHYITKLFCMVTTETRRISDNYPARPDKEGLKTIEKDVKLLSKFFVDRSLFIKIHMIYKKLIPNFAGAPFLELAQFYNVLNTNPQCAKLLKDTVKKSEYKMGLTRIAAMYVSENKLLPQDYDNNNAKNATSPQGSQKSKSGRFGSILGNRN